LSALPFWPGLELWSPDAITRVPDAPGREKNLHTRT
jgi:hypothetical protein